MTSENPIRDKRRTPVSGKIANFVLKERSFRPEFNDQVTSVAVVAFTKDGKIVATIDKRGPDFPGGHIAEHETSFEETANRESLEEAGIELGTLKFLRAIESDFYPGEITYMVIMTGIVSAIVGEPSEGQRTILTIEEFKQQHTALKPELVAALVDEAYSTLFAG